MEIDGEMQVTPRCCLISRERKAAGSLVAGR
jgi:hypothetical protein